MDCKAVVDRIHSNVVDHTELGDLFSACKHLLSLKPSYKVHFVKRQTNASPHSLAKVAATTALTGF